ncbi:MAG: hypothetical protein QOE96_978, partial [Blastocatellia bacterium]|nr:hypothetical protein [Blastocatellia bacterium]
IAVNRIDLPDGDPHVKTILALISAAGIVCLPSPFGRRAGDEGLREEPVF